MALSRGSRWFLAGVLVLVAAGAGTLAWIDANLFGSGVEPGIAVDYEVTEGQTVRAVGEDLAERGVVSSAVRFRFAAEDAGLAARLLPGTYALETGMSNDEVIEILAEGPPPPPTVWFTVPEGLPVELTLERLASQFDGYDVDDFREVLDARRDAGANGEGLLRLPEWLPEPAEFSDETEPFEGVLFPETYEVLEMAAPRDILQRMVDQLEHVLDEVGADARAAADEAGRSTYDMMIIASLIERETRVDEERSLVSGVIEGRLADGMRLQIDATVLYARGEHTERVLLEDTEIDSPYNTYQVDGLPPTPISGFGAASLHAAYEPADVAYRYYVLDPSCDGTHVFAESLEEHNQNVAAFRDAGGCR
ncbi:MAG: endolytic transglycosylase MltG [Nitriliruptoraceae bacterium]